MLFQLTHHQHASVTFGLLTIPPKYLFDIAIVRFTKFPKTLAKS